MPSKMKMAGEIVQHIFHTQNLILAIIFSSKRENSWNTNFLMPFESTIFT